MYMYVLYKYMYHCDNPLSVYCCMSVYMYVCT